MKICINGLRSTLQGFEVRVEILQKAFQGKIVFASINNVITLMLAFCCTLNAQLLWAQVDIISGSHATSKVSYVPGLGSNRMLVVTVSNECDCFISSINYGSTPLTYQLGENRAQSIRLEIWTLDEAGISAEDPAGASFTVNWSGGSGLDLFSVVTIENVDQITPVPDQTLAKGNSISELSVNTPLLPAVNDLIFYGVTSTAQTSHATNVDYIELSDQMIFHTLANAYKKISEADLESPTATMSASGSMAMAALYFQYGGAGTFTTSSNGEWNIGTTWGGTCTENCIAGIDYPDDTFVANIQSGNDVEIPASINAECLRMTVNSDRGTAEAAVTLNSTSSLQISQSLSIQSASIASSPGIHEIEMNGGQLIVSGDLRLEANEGSSSSVNFISGSSSNSKTSYSAGSGSDRLLVVTIGDEFNNSVGTVTSVTWGSTPLTFQQGIMNLDDLRLEIWTLDESGIAGETGAQDFTVNWSAGPNSELFNVFTLENVNQVSPIGSAVSEAEKALNYKLPSALGTSSNDLMFYAAATRSPQTHTEPADYTEVSDQSSAWGMANAFKQITSMSSEQPIVSWPAGNNMAMAGVVIKAIGGGGTFQESSILTGGGTLSVAGDIMLVSDADDANAKINLANTPGSTLRLGGQLIEEGTIGTGQLWEVNNNSTVNYMGEGAQIITAAVGNTIITTISTLTLSGSGDKTLEGDLTINDKLILQESASFADGGHSLTYGSDAILEYNGNEAQTTGDELTSTIEGLVINNSNNVILNSDVTVNDDITFTSGLLILGANDVIANTISGYDEDEYLVTDGTGYLERNVNALSTVDFPVGLSTTSLSNLVQLTPADLSTFRVRVDPILDNAVYDDTKVVDAEWTIDRTVGSAPTTVRLSWRDDGSMTFGSSFDAADIITEIGRWDGSTWINTESSDTDDSSPDYYFEATGFTSFSPFAVGSGGSSLPIELLSFEARLVSKRVELFWTTAVEIGNDFFTIERSYDGIHFEEIERVPGAGTTYTSQRYSTYDYDVAQGRSYYRLKQTDLDGSFEYCDVVSIFNDDIFSMFEVFPNPVEGGSINIRLEGDHHEILLLSLYDNWGRLIYKEDIIEREGYMTTTLQVNPGIYLLKANNSHRSYERKILVR